MNIPRKSLRRVVLQGIALAAVCTAACASHDEELAATDNEPLAAACSSTLKTNTYDGPNYWGTISFANGSKAVTGIQVDFDVPSGAHCTNDTVPSGAKLSPLKGSGSSAATTSNHCTFTWAGASLGSGATKSFNYSTDSSSFSSASHLKVSFTSCGGSGSSSGGSGSGSGSGSSSGGGSGSGSGGGNSRCSQSGLSWKTANKTNFTSYPAPGSPECIQYSGCQYEGEFAACSQTESQSWVKSHNIVSVFPNLNKASSGIAALALHDLCLKDPSDPSNTIIVTVLDECADSDCSGCCTQNKGSAQELIDIESFTDARWGVQDGKIEWADLGPTTGSGCN
ncbi:MAG TPA: hypothetical protein VGI39_40265 [Polyangiaceae bacterium]|jgi:hypothetical protein